MNKEILEITKEFHDTYEKLASEYTYETREDTKVFDINSNNGKLMYATVNEIVSPILKENKILIDNAENNDKVVDNVNWENMLLKKKNKQLQERIEYLERSNNRREDTILEQRQKISDLEDNWNKLRKWIVYNKHNENTEQHYLVVDYGTLLGKMQELEKGVGVSDVED